MNRLKVFLNKIVVNVMYTAFRFPLVLLFLAAMTITMSVSIEDNFQNEALLGRLIFTEIFGALAATAAQFKIERLKMLSKYTLPLHGATILLAVAYYFFMTNDEISQWMIVHSFVISFALFAGYLYVPTYKNNLNFGNVALAHFKAAFTAILYGVVLFLGFVAIFGAIDILLFNLDTKIYGHTANIAFIFFTPMYYLSLLPKFNSQVEDDIKRSEPAFSYPRVLEILVSFIIIPLISIFTVVLTAYFIKILVTGVWPVGQVGPMVLAYSAVGYFIYILSHNLKNKFSLYYRNFFPVIVIPLVIMQLVSSYIRVDAYGITESRYYVILFGIFSIVSALMLLLSKRKNPNLIVLFAAIFAVLSIIPPIDAFTVSKNSQENRLEEILLRNNMLVDNKIVPSNNLADDDKFEITNISDYLARMGYLKDIEWFPKDSATEPGYYSSFRTVYGFSPFYSPYVPGEVPQYVYAKLNEGEEIDIADYNKLLMVNIFNNDGLLDIGSFTVGNDKYYVKQRFEGKGEFLISILDANKETVVEVDMRELIDSVIENANEPKSMISQENLTIVKENENMKLKIIADELSVDRSSKDNVYISGSLFLLVALP